MFAYLFLGGGVVYANSATEFVERMRESSRNPADSIDDFIDDVARRCYVYNASVIRTDSHEHFVQDLKTNDFVIAVHIN